MSVPKAVRSGVTERNDGCWRDPSVRLAAGPVLVGLGVDQENDAAGLAAPDDLIPGDGSAWDASVLVVDDDGCIAGPASHAASSGLVDSMPPPLCRLDFPLTSISKSSSLAPFAWLSKAVPASGPNDMKSSFAADDDPWVAPFAPDSSCSFFVCSSSTLRDRDLMRSMNARNCPRSSKGPRLMLHRMGRMSMATKSASATLPTTRSTLSAAIMTAGSFVLIALIRGTIFSCIVYLSSALLDDAFFWDSESPSRPSSLAGSVEPPHRTTKAWQPRTLMARLLVRLKTVAITGNSSFLMVLKSRTGRITGRTLSAASTTAGVGDSMAVITIGRMSRRGVSSERKRGGGC